jgi:hypothetical protein
MQGTVPIRKRRKRKAEKKKKEEKRIEAERESWRHDASREGESGRATPSATCYW